MLVFPLLSNGRLLNEAIVLSVAILFLSAVANADKDVDEDWNDNNIDWIKDGSWEEVVAKAQSHHKPILLLVHRVWCGACKQLRPKFAESKEISDLSGQLVMVRSSEEGGDYDGEQFKPDGGYFPRILFFNEDGRLMADVVQREDKYKYFHFQAESVVKAMKRAVDINAENNNGKEVVDDNNNQDKDEL